MGTPLVAVWVCSASHRRAAGMAALIVWWLTGVYETAGPLPKGRGYPRIPRSCSGASGGSERGGRRVTPALEVERRVGGFLGEHVGRLVAGP